MTKLETFAALVESDSIQRLRNEHMDAPANIAHSKTRIVPGRTYAKVNIGDSGRYMVEIATGNIFGVKGYGQVHEGHFYGTLDTINEYFWGQYYPVKKINPISCNSMGIPTITTAPAVNK